MTKQSLRRHDRKVKFFFFDIANPSHAKIKDRFQKEKLKDGMEKWVSTSRQQCCLSWFPFPSEARQQFRPITG